jgi:hypothetical protein
MMRRPLLSNFHAVWHSSARASVGRQIYDPERHRLHRQLYGGHDPGVAPVTWVRRRIGCSGFYPLRRAERPQRNQWFADSPLKQAGFEL